MWTKTEYEGGGTALVGVYRKKYKKEKVEQGSSGNGKLLIS